MKKKKLSNEEIDELLAAQDQIAIIWSVEDVQTVRKDLTKAQAFDVLLLAKEQHNPEIGLSWDGIEAMANHLYPGKTKKRKKTWDED